LAHYAFIDKTNTVVMVIPGRDEWEIVEGITDWEAYYSTKHEGLRAVRTSYNTLSGEHLAGGVPFRGTYAGVGFTYDEDLDAFIPPKPFNSWILDKESFAWNPPIDYPNDGLYYEWDETSQSWLAVD